ncbi:MAG: hypothetical protein NC347_13100 [Clostridium sp.]|nr:hypothetical protein [Clostridium sp.]
MKKFFLMILLIFLLLIFHEASISGTKNGLLLWYQTLIPSLMPFLLITNALSETGAYQSVSVHFGHILPGRIYEIMAILLGNLCGYPIGGKIINDFIKNNYLSAKRGNQLLSFASQASPMFLIGYVHIHILENAIPLPVFLLGIYLPVCFLYPLSSGHFSIPGNAISANRSEKFNICDTFMHAVQIMVMIGLYVMIFSILLEILLPFCHIKAGQILLSLLEITNGLNLLNHLDLPASIKISSICALSAFGGLCSAFQIRTVLEYKDASMKKYLRDKLLLSAGTFGIIQCYLLLFG